MNFVVAPQRTVRRRLLMLVLIPSLLVMALLGYFGYRDFQFLHDDLQDHGVTQVKYLAQMAEFGLATANVEDLQTVAEMASGGTLVVRIYDVDDRLRAAAGDTGVPRPVTRPAGAGACGRLPGVFLFCAPVRITPLPLQHFSEFGGATDGSPPVGRVEIALSDREYLSRRAAVIRGYALVLVLVLGMGLMLARGAERQLARPITDLSDAVKQIGQGNLDSQVAEDASGELLTLQRGVNDMAARLASNHAEQERRIAEATAMLRKTLQQLELRNEELNTEKHRAEAASRAKSRFLAVMSHEIRTPLAGMIGMLSLLRRSGLSTEQDGYVRQVEEAAATLRLLIDDILDYSRIEAGKLAVFAEPIRICRIVDEVATMFAPSAADKGLEFIVHMEPDLPDAVIGDGLRLRQVLINLVANAIKFTERGWVRIEVRRLDHSSECPRLGFVVEDSGIGIPEDQVGLVFESFTQVDSGTTRRYGGSGLGATISRDLVHLMGGEIGVTSKAGAGSRFWFELALPVDREAPPAEKPLAGSHVAVVERDERARAAMVAALEAVGAQVVVQGANGNAVAGERMFDYLFLCEDGPESTMDETALRLRPRVRRLCHVISPTGAVRQDLYDCHLSKPVTRVRLQGVVAAHAQQKAGDAPPREVVPLRILVAEDDDINARVVEMLLRRSGHEVTRARDGREALSLLSSRPFDVGILDVRMPELDGPAVAAHWRTREQAVGGHLPLVALTANGSAEDKEMCRAAGMDEFLIKPVNAQVLAQVLEILSAGKTPERTGATNRIHA